jgi:ABC-type cobalamin transport system ATPase subunit
MRKLTTMLAGVAITAIVVVAGPSPAGAAGCSAEMKSITPQQGSIYLPGKDFGQDVAFHRRQQLVHGYVFWTMGDCHGPR